MIAKSIKIGDIFSVDLNNNDRKYFQFIVKDSTQLNSDVIRVFKNIHTTKTNHDLLKVVEGKVDFYAHCITKFGVKMKYWKKVGNVKNIGDIENILFRSSSDDGNPEINISENWWVWEVNKEQKRVGNLIGKNRVAEIGSIIPADSLVYRIRKGVYDFKYPHHK